LGVNKTGYGIVETLSYDLQKNLNVLSPINLAEELPFKYDYFSIDYSSGMLHYMRSTIYKTSDNYLVGELICYGKDSNVSINNCSVFAGTGSYSGVNYINGTINSGASFSIKNFTDNGFQVGQTIYAVCYPIVDAPFTLYNDQRLNYKTTKYKLGNPSQVSSFLLRL
jgi:hypothetical protein